MGAAVQLICLSALVLMAAILAGCVTPSRHDPLDVYRIDMKSFDLPVLLVVPF